MRITANNICRKFESAVALYFRFGIQRWKLEDRRKVNTVIREIKCVLGIYLKDKDTDTE
jgi:hypothetical protein